MPFGANAECQPLPRLGVKTHGSAGYASKRHRACGPQCRAGPRPTPVAPATSSAVGVFLPPAVARRGGGRGVRVACRAAGEEGQAQEAHHLGVQQEGPQRMTSPRLRGDHRDRGDQDHSAYIGGPQKKPGAHERATTDDKPRTHTHTHSHTHTLIHTHFSQGPSPKSRRCGGGFWVWV